jgi:NAD(P)H-hydrate epimerase
VKPVVTVAEMRAADAAALAEVDEAVLVGRAGTAVAGAARALLGPAYGRRVVVVAGKGNNGADGRVAARRLARRGARVTVIEAVDAPPVLPRCDLVIDAAYGTGFRGTYVAPVPAGPDGGSATPVLAVDIPSGVDGDTGEAGGRPLAATATVTFAAYKPGLLQADGPGLAGRVTLVDIGVDVGHPAVHLVEDADVADRVPAREAASHKWASAVAVVAGSPGMEGAALFCARGASRAGAGMVRLAVPGSAAPSGGTRPGPWPPEAVRLALAATGWADDVLGILGRCRVLVIGPGLGRDEATQTEIRSLIARSPVPVVADADALVALGDPDRARPVVAGSGRVDRPVVLTPHDGEYATLAGHPPGPDRLAAVRHLAARTGAVVLLKGPLTAIGAPGPAGAPTPVLLANAGSPRLATAGTGDVLSGVIGALLARGVPAPEAAALGAHVHGRAAGLGPAEGLVAADLPDLVSTWMSSVLGGADRGPGRG